MQNFLGRLSGLGVFRHWHGLLPVQVRDVQSPVVDPLALQGAFALLDHAANVLRGHRAVSLVQDVEQLLADQVHHPVTDVLRNMATSKVMPESNFKVACSTYFLAVLYLVLFVLLIHAYFALDSDEAA